MEHANGLRWDLVGSTPPQLALFDDRPVRRVGSGEYRGLEFLEVRAKEIINRVPPGFLPFEHTINVYRGCSHGCVYCFARPTHEYLGLNLSADFDSKIVVKVNAAELVRVETDPVRWAGDVIAMGTNTDPYQPAEGKYRLTRGVIDVLIDRANPFSVLTKSPLVLRDLDLVAAAAGHGLDVRVDLSIGTLDEAVWRATEPGTAHPQLRMNAVQRLNEAGVRSAVVMGPVIPGISDSDDQLREVVSSAVAAGARGIFAIPLHLKPGVKEHYFGWLREAYPHLVARYERRYGTRAYPPASVGRDLSQRLRGMIDELAPSGHPIRRISSKGRAGSSRPASRRTHQTAFGLGD